MKRAVLTAAPPLVSSVTSTRPRRFTTSTRRPARVATTSYVLEPSPASTTTSTLSPFITSVCTRDGASEKEQLDRGDQPDHHGEQPERRRLQAAPEPRAKQPAYRGPGGDQRRGPPRDVREPEEHGGRRAVDDRDEDVLGPVDALQGLVEKRAEQADDQDPLGGAEVAAVGSGREDACQQRRAGPLRLLVPARADPRAQPRLRDHQRAGDQDQHWHDEPERAGRQGQQRDRPGQRAHPGSDAEPEQ